jgi:hypothetical protein
MEGCERTMHINAQPDGKLIQTQIDIEQNASLVARFVFVQHLVAAAAGDVTGGQP